MYILLIYTFGGAAMTTTRVFMSGNSQAVRLPKEFQFDVDEVEILRCGDDVILRKKPVSLAEAFELLAALPDDFMSEGRHNPPTQPRDEL